VDATAQIIGTSLTPRGRRDEGAVVASLFWSKLWLNRLGLAGVLAAAVFLPMSAGAAPKSPSVTVPNGGTPPAKGTWSILVQPNKRWVLHGTFKENRAQVIVVETYDVHQVGGATVARLRWTVKQNVKAKDGDSIGSEGGPLFTRLAVNERGLYILRDDMDDAAIATVVQGKPSRSEPPRSYEGTKKNHGRYLHVYDQEDGPVVCMGEGPEPGAGDCDDTCFAEVCFVPTKGVVEISGTAAPENAIFAQPGFELRSP